MKRFLMALALLALTLTAQAQSINQHSEALAYMSPQVRWLTYVVDWSYPSPSNPATSGMNTWATLQYQFIYPDGTYSNTYETSVGQRTFGGNFQGSYGATWQFNIVSVTDPQRPTLALILGFRWKCKANSTVYWGSPQNFLTDTWTTPTWETYWY